jgi:hypothetical protein
MQTDPVPLPVKAVSGSAFLWISVFALFVLVLGAVMWNENGAAVFTALVSAAIAWCF